MSMRRDVSVYNEATGFVITSTKVFGKFEEIDDPEGQWVEGIQSGAFLAVELVQDDPIHCRIILDDVLTPEEEGEVVQRCAWKLRVPDGKLVIAGGIECLIEEVDEDDEFVQILDIPRGDYRLDLYTCFAGVNGPYLYWGNYDIDANKPGATRAKPEGGPLVSEPVGAWFRRTRPGEPFPYWLKCHCLEDERCDPGHEEEWKEDAEVEEESPPLVDFLVRLTPLERAEPLPEEPPSGKGPFVPARGAVCLPARCPMGLVFEE